MNSQIKSPPFGFKWWENFLKKTNDLKKTSVVKDCMDVEETEEMRKMVLHIIRLIIKFRSQNFGFRLFVEGKPIQGKKLDDFFDSALPNDDETFEHWSKRCFQEKKYGIIINRGEKFNPKLVAKIARKIKPLMDNVGIPRVGVTFTIFIGNYGWTPLGIHTDGIGENVMHFHLGKGGKTMYTWDTDAYENNVEESKRFNNTNIQEIMHLANEFPFEEGDIYYMPNGEYHVGKSDELSIGLTLWFNNHTKGALSRKIFDSFYQQNFIDDETILEMDKSEAGDIDNFQDIENTFQSAGKLKDQSGYKLFQETYLDYKMALFSNCGFWEAPFPNAEQLDNEKDYMVQIVDPFNILYSVSNKLNLFVRGTKISLVNDPSILQLIKKMNDKQTLSKTEAFSILNPEWENKIKEYILSVLFSNHVLQVTYV